MPCASLDELLLDYEDFLRTALVALGQRHARDDPRELAAGQRLVLWGRGIRPIRRMFLGCHAPWLNHREPAIVANTVICLIHQTNYLLDQQIGALESGFIHEGGYSERLAAARIEERQRRDDLEGKSNRQFPACPLCGKLMALRTARQGKHAGARSSGAARPIRVAKARGRWRAVTRAISLIGQMTKGANYEPHRQTRTRNAGAGD